MNRENMEKLAAHLEQIDERTFTMADWLARTVEDEDRRMLGLFLGDELPRPEDMRPPTEHECGTAACVAGHAVSLLGTDEDRSTCGLDTGAIEHVATGLLGLGISAARHLFYGPWETPREAAGALRALAAGA